MASERNFCSNCGKPVGPQEKFCAYCGHTLAAPAVSVPPVAITEPANTIPLPAKPDQNPIVSPSPIGDNQEVIFGVIAASRKTGMFSQESLHIIVTGKRLICAAFTNEMIKQAAKEEGKSGFFSGMVGAATLGFTYYKRYLNIAPDLALKENPQNFAIERGNIRKIKLEIGRKQADRNRHVDVYEPSKLEIEAGSQKYNFSVPNHFHEMASAVLRQAGLV